MAPLLLQGRPPSSAGRRRRAASRTSPHPREERSIIPDLSVVYLHGFTSSPASTKAVFFQERLEARGMRVVVPDLNEDDFEGLTVSRMLTATQRAVDEAGTPVVLVGSSLGGYLASLFASRGGACEGMVLLAPAFDLGARWAAMAGPDGIERWRMEGRWMFEHHAWGRPEPLGFGFYEDALQYPAWPPAVARPHLLLHGVRDDVVPVEASREYLRRHPEVRLTEVATDHDMTEALPELWDHTEAFFDDHGWFGAKV